ncbi:zinc metallopeptidase, SprT family [Syntrophotalea carbinolica DSM 2380]|uniref:Zinc metallopeptidase, SprT family n=1 Tax=Syntrophotalea carbinolica (strain DSM 2380 / NBRC 103641 / GraBd1) TaxID=338963 RepID=Q3A0M7_SYNC1|nr:SprT-like domain-containing protein [Syntrophotalea carbinolica]ABA90080.1 zinc metallopeptidase, SprT family [Syntrophotalea carbinolica DSM 2380]
MEKSGKPNVTIGEKVRFVHAGQEQTGIVARVDRRQLYILGDDRRSYQVRPDKLLSPSTTPSAVPPPTVELPRAGASNLQFNVNDRVSFCYREQTVTGRIARLNPKRALVVCDNNDEYRVPYEILVYEPGEVADGDRSPDDALLLAGIEEQAAMLLKRYGLKNWRFAFDDATRRAGSCRYSRKTITLSRHLARNASEDEILDTLLHEIAHALVGPRHNHDAVWRAKAVEIGSSGERCHELRFAPPRYIVSCRNGCWSATAERRRRNVVCSKCKGEIVYQTFTQERWEQQNMAK